MTFSTSSEQQALWEWTVATPIIQKRQAMQNTQYFSGEARAAVSTWWGLLIFPQGCFVGFFFKLLHVFPNIYKDIYLSLENSTILKECICHYSSASAEHQVGHSYCNSIHPKIFSVENVQLSWKVDKFKRDHSSKDLKAILKESWETCQVSIWN